MFSIRNAYLSALFPVVLCPYLRTSDPRCCIGCLSKEGNEPQVSWHVCGFPTHCPRGVHLCAFVSPAYHAVSAHRNASIHVQGAVACSRARVYRVHTKTLARARWRSVFARTGSASRGSHESVQRRRPGPRHPRRIVDLAARGRFLRGAGSLRAGAAAHEQGP